MAFQQILPQGSRTGAGVTPGFSVPAGVENVEIRLTSSDWLPSTDGMWFTISRSDDGGATWRPITSGDVQEGARKRDGSMWGLKLYIGGTPCDLRAEYAITGTLRFGLEREFTDAAGTPV